MRSRADGTPGRVLLATLAEPGAEIVLPDDESHYVTRVCRARPGETLTATDGRGGVARLRLLETRAAARARVEEVRREARGREAWLLCGAPEGPRADWLVEKLAELGVARLLPVDTARARWQGAHARPDRLRRVAEAGLRQSRRAWLLGIETVAGLDAALAGLPAGGSRWLADPDGIRPRGAASERVCVGAVGPAEGFTTAERASLEACGFAAMSLADGRLRCETAAIAWASWWALGA
jgi:16S rRNA (uracil1498-N3)-methyltransferase